MCVMGRLNEKVQYFRTSTMFSMCKCLHRRFKLHKTTQTRTKSWREPRPTRSTRRKPAVPEDGGTQMYNIKAFTKCTNVNHKACKKPAFR